MIAFARPLVRRILSPVARRGGRAFLGGSSREEALEVADRLMACGFAVTLAYWWDARSQPTPGAVQSELHACIVALAGRGGRPRVAVKAPALAFNADAVTGLARVAGDASVGLAFDSHAPTDADATLRLARLARDAGADTAVALPARWSRTDGDAQVALHGLSARVVKGQWPDDTPGGGPRRDATLRDAYVAVLKRLAAGSGQVSVASHDVRLLRRVLDDSAGGTPEVELLLGMPAARILRLAAQHGAPVRFYIAYGTPSLPFRPSSALWRPRLGVILTRSIILGSRNRRRRVREAVESAAAASGVDRS